MKKVLPKKKILNGKGYIWESSLFSQGYNELPEDQKFGLAFPRPGFLLDYVVFWPGVEIVTYVCWNEIEVIPMKCEYKTNWPRQHPDRCQQEATRTIQVKYPHFTVTLTLCGEHADHIMALEAGDATDISDTPEARHK